MYQLPIEIIYKEIRTEHENNVYKAIQEYGVAVDKEELIKALKYDRGQYDKGYSDGAWEARSKVAIKVIEYLERNGLLNMESWAIDGLKKKYTEGCSACSHFLGCECFDGETCDRFDYKNVEIEK